MARRTVWVGGVAALGVAATVGAIVGTAPAAPAARTSDSGAQALHPNLVRAADFAVGIGALTQDVPTQAGATYRLSLDPPAAPVPPDYEVTFGTGTTELTTGARPIELDVPATGSTTRLTVAARTGRPALPALLAVRRVD